MMSAGVWVTVRSAKDYLGRTDIKVHSWFRCSNRLLEDADFDDFNDAELLVWIHVLSLISQKKCETVFVDFDRALRFAKRNQRDVETALAKLAAKKIVSLGVRNPSAIRTGRVRNPCATEQTNGTNTPERIRVLYALAVSWNEEVKTLAKVKKTNGKRLALCTKHEPEYDNEEWRKIFRQADSSKFLCGGGSTGWKATFEWVLKNASRVDEGEFDNKREVQGAGSMRGVL